MPVRTIRYQEPSGPDWAARAFAGPEALYKAQVMESTWGHLAPKQGVKYRGFVLFTIGCFGDLTIIDYEFNSRRGVALDGSPWLYDDLHGFVGDFSQGQEHREGKVYRFDGTYSQSEETGEYRFNGTVSRIQV